MNMGDDINLFFGKYWLQASTRASNTYISIYKINNFQMPASKLSCVIDPTSFNPYLFTNNHEFLDFLKEPQNFILQYDEHVLFLVWQFVAQGYRKEIKYFIQLTGQQLGDVDKLKYQNYLLKKKLCEIQTSTPQNVAVNQNKQMPIENQDKKNLGIVNSLVKIEEQVYPHISISSTDRDRSSTKKKPGRKPSKDKPISKRRGRPKGTSSQQSNKCTINKEPQKRKRIQKGPRRKRALKSEKIGQKNEEEGIQNRDDPDVISITSHNIEKKSNLGSCSILIQKPTDKYLRTIKPYKQIKKNVVLDSRTEKVNLQFENGDTYYGEVIDDIYHGYGIYKSKSGSFYEGYWVNGKAEGKGTSVDQFGNKYVGQFYSDKRHGKGIEVYENGQKYQGNFINDYKEGYGKYNYQNGDYYEGQWKENMCEGKGKQVYADGAVYYGIWMQDQKNGEGHLVKPNGQKLRQVYLMGELIKEYLQQISAPDQKARVERLIDF